MYDNAEINALMAVQDDEKIIDEFFTQGRRFKALMLKYKCALMEIETKFKILDAEFSLHNDRNPIESIKTRLKEPLSIYEKLKRKELPLSIKSIEEEILDIAGVRIICSFEEDVYYLCNCLSEQSDIELLTKKDYIKKPKPNGYRSLHMTVKVPVFFAEEVSYVPVEIQFRTMAMDFWASLEHKIRYKKDLHEDRFVSDQLLACARSSMEWDERMAGLMHLLHDGYNECSLGSYHDLKKE